MKIGIVTTWFERGAAYVSRQYKKTLEKENEIFIYARGGEKFAIGDPEWESKNVTWGKDTCFPFQTAINLKHFRNWIIKNSLEVVFFNEQHWWIPVAVCNELNIITGSYIDYYTEETIPLFQHYDFLICNTKRHYETFNWHPQCYYIPWGTEINVFKPTTQKLVNKGFLTFFHSAGMSPERKGCDLVLKSFSKVQGPAKLFIHSQVNLKEYFPNLSGLINDLESRGLLEIHENTVKAPGLYNKGDVYVYPSRLEGVGLTIAEAISCGLPVISSNNAPMNEFIDDEVNGKLVKIKKYVSRKDGYYWPQCLVDEEDLTMKMQWYLDNLDKIEYLKIKTREYAEQYFNWEDNSSVLNSILKTITKMPDNSKQKSYFDIVEFEKKRGLSKIKYPYWWIRKKIGAL